MRFVVEIASARGARQGRARVVEVENGLVIALADGAGGTGNGALAADALVRAIEGETTLPDGDRCAALIENLDAEPQRLARGQSTAVILGVGTQIVGASVGDSGAWLLRGSEVVDLTSGQIRKPLVGDGCATVPIGPLLFEGTLLVASDGLFRYAKRADIARVIEDATAFEERGLATAAAALIELVHLPNGELQDDVAIVLVHIA